MGLSYPEGCASVIGALNRIAPEKWPDFALLVKSHIFSNYSYTLANYGMAGASSQEDASIEIAVLSQVTPENWAKLIETAQSLDQLAMQAVSRPQSVDSSPSFLPH